MNYAHIFYAFLVTVTLLSCKEEPKAQQQTVKETIYEPPAFDADMAYQFVADQVAFGPRVPGTPEHKKASAWLEKTLGDYTDKAFIQKGQDTMYNGNIIPIYNIIGSINEEVEERVLLAAHWDSRHVADKDADPKQHNQPILGANDGASGVAVLLEIARQLQLENSDLGIDFIFFDAEDLGTPVSEPSRTKSWCLGSQYWGNNPHTPDYKAKYGILLDMVGAGDATFKYERQAYRKAAPLYTKVWNMAHQFGHNDKFVKAVGGSITDDHIYVMGLREFPMIDIIDFDNNKPNGGFGHYHHTQQDNMDVINKSTLRAVGETVLGVLKYEN